MFTTLIIFQVLLQVGCLVINTRSSHILKLSSSLTMVILFFFFRDYVNGTIWVVVSGLDLARLKTRHYNN